MKYFSIFGLEYPIKPSMNRIINVILILLAVALSSCKEEKHASYMTNLKAAEYFEKVEQICNTDRADLWGIDLYGPLMMIDRVTREVYANVQDAEGLLKPKDGIFVGTYPKEQIIGTIPVEYGGTLFAMARLRSDEDEYTIKTRCVHALFHCAQIKKEIDTPDYRASHLNEKTARLWVKLEWRALQRAIRTSGETRTQAIRDALVFRSARREMYPRFINDENFFENNEGITAFTYIYICNEPGEEYFRQLQNFYDRIYNWSYPYSWGYINGALYSHLLFESDFDFKSISGRDTDLGELIMERYDIVLPEISRDIAGSLAFNYDIDLINQEELEREVKLREARQKSVSKFVDRPVIYLELESPNFSFEPGDMTTVDSLGTIYETLRVSDNWGKIAVDEGGCLVSPGLEYIRIPAKNIKKDRNHISGEGWHIILNDSWHMEEFEDNYIITKLLP
jgi:hypothetical protein